MKNRSGQVSAEFMILVGLVLIIFIPLFVILTLSSIESTEQISTERIGSTARTMLDESREIYYLGEGSRQIITIDIPRGVHAVQIVNTSTTYELVFAFTQSGINSSISHVSEVPVRINEAQTTSCNPVPSCVDCDCEQFTFEEGRSGARNIELRTIRDDGLAVSMRIVS